MVLQYKKKDAGRWVDYPGKDNFKGYVSHYNFRLLSKDRLKVLAIGDYKKILKRFKQIELLKKKG